VEEEASGRLREQTAQARGDAIAGVERYDVGLLEVPSEGAVSGLTDTVVGATDSVRGVTDDLLGGGEEKQH
jgi:hypothetical protein